MISYKQSKKILRNSKIIIENELIKRTKCINRVTATNVLSKMNYPSGNNAAFDGYAIDSKDTNKLSKKKNQLFKIIGIVAAGDKPVKEKKKKFQTIEIMTGGLLPKGFDTIIPIEQIIFYPNKQNPKFILVNNKVKKNQHVRFKGSDFKKDDLIIKKGTLLKANHILALKTLGISNIKVKKIPKILFFSTGNEITNKEEIPDWKIRNSNSNYIESLQENFLFNFKNGGILRDKDKFIFEKKIKK